MYVLKNLTNKGLHLRSPEWYLLPGDYMTYDPDDRPVGGPLDTFSWEIRKGIKEGKLKYRYVEPLSMDWPKWAFIEWTKHADMRAMRMQEPHSRIHRQGLQIEGYLKEKIPHKDPVVVYLGDVFGVVWLQKVGEKLWSRVLRPGLIAMSKELDCRFCYARKQHYRHTLLELKLYFIWYAGHAVACVKWDDVEKLVKEHIEFYPPTLADVWNKGKGG